MANEMPFREAVAEHLQAIMFEAAKRANKHDKLSQSQLRDALIMAVDQFATNAATFNSLNILLDKWETFGKQGGSYAKF